MAWKMLVDQSNASTHAGLTPSPQFFRLPAASASLLLMTMATTTNSTAKTAIALRSGDRG